MSSSKSDITGSQPHTATVSASGTAKAGGRPPFQKKKSIRMLGPEKKIGEDEFMAAAIGDVEWLKQSIRGNRGQINYDKNGLAPLHLAAIHGRLECLRVLIEKFKVDVNLPSKTGWRPIHLVISNQTGKRAFQCLGYLLSRDADPSATNEDAITPMHQAASEGHVQCLKALIEIGAKVKGVDYRGHTPLDLAKLWGHRKCARILATEEWHQDKEFLAKEMNQLEKLKMQQVLQEIEADQETKAHQEFYGDLAFKDWLSSRGLEPKPTGPNKLDIDDNTENRREFEKQYNPPPQQKKAHQDSTYKANSIQRPPGPSVRTTDKQSVDKQPQERKKVAVSQPQAPQPRTREPDTYRAKPIVVKDSKKYVTEKEDPEPIANSSPQTPVTLPWNKSTKISPKEYVPILQDHYPHDEYTMMPRHPPRISRTPTMLEDDEEHEDFSKHSRTPEPKSPERAVVYKCKHIADIHKKKHFDDELLPKSELGMHLANDPESRLFQKGLLAISRNDSRAVESFRPTQSMDLMSMMNLMERMTKPTHFPPIKGVQYDLHVEQKV